MTASPIAAIGVDLGGTWFRACAVDARGRPLKRHRARALPTPQLIELLARLLQKWTSPQVPLVVASKGVWTPAERRRLGWGLSGLGSRIEVISDVEAAWLAAFGATGKRQGARGARKIHGRVLRRPPPVAGQGVIVVAGTGSIAYGRDADGCRRRAGGLGPILGDEGSAFWIGREWLRRQDIDAARRRLERLNRSGAVIRDIAALAPSVLKKASGGHPAARRIVREAQAHLADLAAGLARRLHWRGAVPVGGSGRLLEIPAFRAVFESELRRRLGRRLRPVRPRGDAAAAAARHALTLGDGPPSPCPPDGGKA